MYAIPLILAALVIMSGTTNVDSIQKSINCFDKFGYVKQVHGVPFAKGNCNAFWPILSTNSRRFEVPYMNISNQYVNGNSARAFAAIRADGDRYHVGIDLYCNDQDVCVACEDGIIVGIQGFLNITKALLLQTTSGIVCLYGEIEDQSWKEFGIQEGNTVKKGQKICRIGKNQAGTQMLHFETYTNGTTKNTSWYKGKSAPSNILNPTKYLLNIASKFNANS